MKARIRQKDSGFYVGEVYGTWENYLLETEWTGWKVVTDTCFTKWGAKRELEAWKRQQFPDEFEI